MMFIVKGFSQEMLSLNSSNSCSINGQLSGGAYETFRSSAEALDIVDNILRQIGAERSFIVLRGNVPNALATIRTGKRYIIYNPDFLDHLINVSQSYWSAIGVLAHEIGHHINGHTLDGVGSRPPKELKADEFAGFIMFKLGASLEQAQSTFNNGLLYREHDSRTHPRTSARLEAIALGWQNAKELSIKPKNKSDLANVEAYIDLADTYHFEKNYTESLKWYRKAAAFGDTYAQYSIADFYEEGIGGVEQDWGKAIYWYKRAASQGEPEAQFWLGTLYEEGEVVSPDLEKAKYWYLKSCQNGDDQGCNALRNLNR